jgi:hypothetical protein
MIAEDEKPIEERIYEEYKMDDMYFETLDAEANNKLFKELIQKTAQLVRDRIFERIEKMGERYWISGVQLGLLMSQTLDRHEIAGLLQNIEENQFIGNEKDLKKISSK